MDEKDTPPLVFSKLYPVVPTNKCVDRPRLYTVLESSLSQKLSLVCAPAGYGKTTIVAQWLNTVPHPSAWLALDEHDRDLSRFLRYVIASIQNIFPQFNHDFKYLLSLPRLPPIDWLVDTLIADISALAKPMVLVLDNLEHVGSEPLQLLSRLIHYLPDHLHLVIMTRLEPNFPLADWRAKGWLCEIRSDDLRFSDEEARTYLTASLNRQIPDTVLEQIVTLTEGWALGIQLAALSLESVQNIESKTDKIKVIDRHVIDFMMQEVFVRQPAEVKSFLVLTSLFNRFCASLCNSLLRRMKQKVNSARLIEYLQKQNLFVVSLDREGVWYRYHSVFQTFLAQQMEEFLPPGYHAKIYKNAGEWFVDHGHPEEGLEYFIKAGELDAAAEFVGMEMHALIDQDNSRFFLRKWLKLFPNEAEKKRPDLLLAHAYLKVMHWDLDGIDEMLDGAETLLQKPGCEVSETRRQALSADIEVLRAFRLYWKGDAEGALHNARLYLEREIPWKCQYAYTLAISYAAGSSALCGRLDEALLLLENALETDCKEGSPNAAHLLMVRAVIHLYRANFAEVEENVRKAAIVHNSIPQPDYWMGYAPYLRGCIAYEKNLLPEAAGYFNQIAEHKNYRVNARMYHDTLIGLALIAWERGEIENSGKYADRALAFAIEAKDSLSRYFSELIRIRCAILSGEAAPEPPQRKNIIGSNLFWLESPTLIHAEYFISMGTQSECSMGLEIIEESLPELQRHFNVRQEIQYLAAKALALWRMSEKEKALEVLEISLFMARPQGLVRSFVNRGPLMAEPIYALFSKQPRDQYLKTLMEAFGNMTSSSVLVGNAIENSSQTVSSSESSAVASLTNRELDVLELLHKRLTNKEIAEYLNISPITVKSHSVQLYRKLDVHGRRQAVDKAKDLGLLRD